MTDHIQSLPPEIIMQIFSFIKPNKLAKCREVCWRWKNIVDDLCTSGFRWRRHCRNDFEDTFEIAYNNRMYEMSWYNIYRSLTLWKQLAEAVMFEEELPLITSARDEIRSFQLLKFGEIGVHTVSGIVYYDLKTLRKTNRKHIKGNYWHYTENDKYFILLKTFMILYIHRKTLPTPHHQVDAIFYEVKDFLVTTNLLYYVTLDNRICVCDLDKEVITSRVIVKMNGHDITCMAYTNNQLQILTLQLDIYSLVGDELSWQCSLVGSRNIIYLLESYNLMDKFNWRLYFQWQFIPYQVRPAGLTRDVTIVKMYGQILFIGFGSGILHIYHIPSAFDDFNLYMMKPVKHFDFRESDVCPSRSPIMQIEVLEIEDGHVILVGVLKRIIVLNFTHNFMMSLAVRLKMFPGQGGSQLTEEATNYGMVRQIE